MAEMLGAAAERASTGKDTKPADVPARGLERWGHFLVPVRGGPDAVARVQLALGLAAVNQARVTALYVVDERVISDPDVALMRDQLHEQLHEEGRTTLAAIRQAAESQPISLETRIEHGHVVEVVLRVAEEIAADVIVVGSHRQTWLGRLLGGSVAEAIVAAARCVVLVVPPIKPETKG